MVNSNEANPQSYKFIKRLEHGYYLCSCVNGHEFKVRADHWKSGRFRCSQCPKNDMTGKEVKGFKFLKYLYRDKSYNQYYLVRCFCGKEFIVTRGSIISGHTKSCGCKKNKFEDVNADNRFPNWNAMRQRVLNPKHQSYNRYHSIIKGKVIEEDWIESPELFFEEIGEKPEDSDTIDRIDNSKGYIYGNVQWASKKEQQNNRFTKVGKSGYHYIYPRIYTNRTVYVTYAKVGDKKVYLGEYTSARIAYDTQQKYLKEISK